jgi:hypothetical protein
MYSWVDSHDLYKSFLGEQLDGVARKKSLQLNEICSAQGFRAELHLLKNLALRATEQVLLNNFNQL